MKRSKPTEKQEKPIVCLSLFTLYRKKEREEERLREHYSLLCINNDMKWTNGTGWHTREWYIAYLCNCFSFSRKQKKKINDDVCEECVRQMDSRSFLYSNWNKEKKCLEWIPCEPFKNVVPSPVGCCVAVVTRLRIFNNFDVEILN